VLGWGYRYGEVPLAPYDTNFDPDTRITAIKPYNTARRFPVYVSLGCHVIGAACPHPDVGDSLSLMAGAQKRFLTPNLPVEPGIFARLRLFTLKELPLICQPLAYDEYLCLVEWLEKSEYPLWRKEELLKVALELPDPDTYVGVLHKREIGEHTKAEPYTEYKHHRPINAAKDEEKVSLGPVFKSIEKKMFQHCEYIKKIPLPDRPGYIEDYLSFTGLYPFAGDASSWEARQRRPLMFALEMAFYEYMLVQMPDLYWARILRITGLNRIQAKHFVAWVLARRMSGEMNTSLGNGFNMRMIVRFVCLELLGNTVCRGVYEGDDSLVVVDKVRPDAAIFLRLGIKMSKIDHYETVCEASFCGMVYDPIDLANLPDPRKSITTFGWSTKDYVNARPKIHRMLLVAKAYSYLSAYNGAPVLQALALWVLKGVPHNRQELYDFVAERAVMDSYSRARLVEVLRTEVAPRPVGIRSRLVMEAVYDMTLQQQYALEEFFEGPIQPIPLHLLEPVHADWLDYWNRYVFEVDFASPLQRTSLGYIFPRLDQLDGFVYQTPVTHEMMHIPRS